MTNHDTVRLVDRPSGRFTHDRIDISVCVDCMVLIANGDLPDDEERAAEVGAMKGIDDGWDVVMSCPDECEGWFSWQPCDACQSSLGGDRHPAVMMRRRPATFIESAEIEGRRAGESAASWFFDGNTSLETYRRVQDGIDEGDPEVLDTFPSSPLSGEWADGVTPMGLVRSLGLDPHDIDEDDQSALCDAYEGAYDEAVATTIESACRSQLDL